MVTLINQMDKTPSEIIEELYSAIVISEKSKSVEKARYGIDVSRIALKAVFEAAIGGNVRCKEALKEILLLNKPSD